MKLQDSSHLTKYGGSDGKIRSCQIDAIQSKRIYIIPTHSIETIGFKNGLQD